MEKKTNCISCWNYSCSRLMCGMVNFFRMLPCFSPINLPKKGDTALSESAWKLKLTCKDKSKLLPIAWNCAVSNVRTLKLKHTLDKSSLSFYFTFYFIVETLKKKRGLCFEIHRLFWAVWQFETIQRHLSLSFGTKR